MPLNVPTPARTKDKAGGGSPTSPDGPPGPAITPHLCTPRAGQVLWGPLQLPSCRPSDVPNLPPGRFPAVPQHPWGPLATHVPPQEWSEELGRLAGARAASCLEGPAPPPAPQLGWSEVLLPVGIGGFGAVLERWFAEGRRYDYGTGRCASNATCHHYTQVGTGGWGGTDGGSGGPGAGVTCTLSQLVWATAGRLGCGRHLCPGSHGPSEAFACAYSPG